MVEFLPLLALAGLAAGYLLGVIAPEEISSGRKYFRALLRVFGSITVGLLLFFLWNINVALITVYFLISSSLIFWKKRTMVLEIVLYALLLLPLFLLQTYLQPTLTSILFLYGLPLGTLIYETQKRS
ncbi:hypothetical protein COV20_01035 [Candidatus Woesearchaeota archaeon CG10_big_fil_rev_8_21_14_0_10_45_16]|nr:MAG: hypothetical protein COV20_01035 [Candidatus Woesearchaeota archaeon CG10_big_fil_rev_8_21_14_0_10_45_16]